MFVRAAALVFLFFIRRRYPHSKSVTEITRKRHEQNTVKRLRKLEKLQIDIEFLVATILLFQSF